MCKPFTVVNQKARAACETAVCKHTILHTQYILLAKFLDHDDTCACHNI